jgi:hypothetical protein
MAQITTTTVQPGETTSASAVNAIYTNIATASTDLDSDNTQSEWVSRRHLTNDLVAPYTSIVTTTNIGGAYSSETFTAVTHGTPLELTPSSMVLQYGDVLRICGNIRSGESSYSAGASDDYAFGFYWTYDDGSGATTAQVTNSMDYWYGISSRDAGSGGKQTYHYQRHGFSHLYIHLSAVPRTVSSIKMMVKVHDNTGITSLALRQGLLMAIHTRS